MTVHRFRVLDRNPFYASHAKNGEEHICSWCTEIAVGKLWSFAYWISRVTSNPNEKQTLVDVYWEISRMLWMFDTIPQVEWLTIRNTCSRHCSTRRSFWKCWSLRKWNFNSSPLTFVKRCARIRNSRRMLFSSCYKCKLNRHCEIPWGSLTYVSSHQCTFPPMRNEDSGHARACSVKTRFFSSWKRPFTPVCEFTSNCLATKIAECRYRAGKETIFSAQCYLTASYAFVWVERDLHWVYWHRKSMCIIRDLLLVNWSLTNQPLQDWTWRPTDRRIHEFWIRYNSFWTL